ncbi:MAG: hypothetical protein OXC05_04790 [Halieaceae bacterium]|nr:hypothetical protein [Halieaceae bacterium]
MKTTLSLREYGHLIYDDDLSEAQATRLHILAERSVRRMKLPETAVLTRTSKGIKAGQVVGLLSVPGITLEILPKIDGDDGAVRKALIHMLAVAWNLRIAHGEIALRPGSFFTSLSCAERVVGDDTKHFSGVESKKLRPSLCGECR